MDMIKPSSITLEFLNTGQQGIPLIICTDSGRVYKRLESAKYQVIQLNAPVSKALLDYSPDERPAKVEAVFKKTLNTDSSVLITDFEMLFDPRYEIDVIKLFCDRARITNVAVKWPGKYTNGKLTYAEPGDPDYHEYDCNAYQIRIVQ